MIFKNQMTLTVRYKCILERIQLSLAEHYAQSSRQVWVDEHVTRCYTHCQNKTRLNDKSKSSTNTHAIVCLI